MIHRQQILESNTGLSGTKKFGIGQNIIISHLQDGLLLSDSIQRKKTLIF